jgi:hypothetical protein
MTSHENKQLDSTSCPFDDSYWIARGNSKLLTYIGPPVAGLDHKKLKAFLRKRGALGAMWNYDHDYCTSGPWYRCICDTLGYDESKIESKNARHNLHRSLKRCVVREVDYSLLAEHAYPVYLKAASRFKNFKIESEEQFRCQLQCYAGDPNRTAFGVFVDGILVAYATLFICEKTVFGDIAHFDPAYANAYPMYALYYTIAHHYLGMGYKEFDRGTRPLLHETNVDEFLLRLGYRQSYCRLGLYFSWPIRVLLGTARIFRGAYMRILPSRYSAILNSLLLAQDIARATR